MPDDARTPRITGEAEPDARAVLTALRSRGNAENAAGMARFGINPEGTLGISMADLRGLARGVLKGRKADAEWRHDLAATLWDSGFHEARILSALVDEPALVTREQMESWTTAFDSWDVCDQVCANLYDRTPHAWDAVADWADRDEEFVKRAAFALIAALAWHDKAADDGRFLSLLALVEREADDSRNFVKKAVNWALRQIGKRSVRLNAAAVETAQRILARDSSRAARWVATDALRELTGEAVRSRLGLTPP